MNRPTARLLVVGFTDAWRDAARERLRQCKLKFEEAADVASAQALIPTGKFTGIVGSEELREPLRGLGLPFYELHDLRPTPTFRPNPIRPTSTRLQTMEEFAIGLATLNGNGLLLDHNRQACEVLGMSEANLKGSSLASHLAPEFASAFRAYLRDCLLGDPTGYLETKTWSGRFIEVHSNVYWSTPTGAMHISLALIDAGRRTISWSRTRLWQLLAELNTAAFGMDLNGRVMGANSIAATMFRRDSETLSKLTCEEILDLDVAQIWTEGVRQTYGVRSDGSHFPVALNITRARMDDGTRFVLVVHDLSDARRNRDEISQLQEFERRRLGLEIHDSLGQQLTALSYMADGLERSLTDSAHKKMASEVATLSRDAIAKARHLSQQLHPLELEGRGLASALQELAVTTSRNCGMQCRFISTNISPVPAGAEAHLYRIAQESVNNAVKHSRGNKIEISLKMDEDALRLQIQDDGVGLPPQLKSGHHLGMRSMRIHSENLQGRLDISSSRTGTLVACEVAIKTILNFIEVGSEWKRPS